MPFLTLGNANIRFVEREPVWRSYMAAEALPTPNGVELVDENEFVAAGLNENNETFVVHIASILVKIIALLIWLGNHLQNH